MPERKSSRRVEMSIDADLMVRLVRYARQHGTTPEAVLLQSIQWLMDRHPTSARNPRRGN